MKSRITTACAGLCLLLGLASAPAPAGAAEPSRDINSYVLFAYDEIRINDAGGASGVTVHGGNVGVNNPSSGDPTFHSLGVDIFMPDASTQLSADKVDMPATSRLNDLFANSVWAGFDLAVVGGAGPTAFSAPIIDSADLPALPVFSAGAANVTVPSGGSLELAPGSYDRVRAPGGGVGAGSTLILKDGVYDLAELIVGDHSTLVTSKNTIVRASKEVTIGDHAQVAGSSSAQFLVRSDSVLPSTASFKIGQKSQVVGQMFAPNGTLRINDGVTMGGRFWAKRIVCDCHLDITYVPPPPPSCDEDATQPQCEVPNCITDPSLPQCQQSECELNPALPQCQPPPSSPPQTPPTGAQQTQASVPAGSAKLSKTKACISRRQKVRVRGRSIRKVVFKLDKRRIKTDRRSPFSVTIRRGKLSFGAHRLSARVKFRSGSGTRSKTLHRSLQRCASRTISPKFTG